MFPYVSTPLAANYILLLHGMLYRYSGRGIGGRFKNAPNYISETRADGTSFVRFLPLEPYETPDAVAAICENYNKAIDDGILDPLLLISIFIYDFLCIHSFNDGNGRISRLLTTLLLYRSGYMVGRYVSLEEKIERSKTTYYDVLHTFSSHLHDGKNDYIPFIKYLLEIILSAYRDFEDRVQLVGEKLPAVELVHRAIWKKVCKFTKSEIMELCPSIKKASVESSLKKLVDAEEITRHSSGKNTFYTRNN